MAVDTARVRDAAQSLMAQAAEMADKARTLPGIVQEAAGSPYLQQVVEQVREAAMVAGATQDTFNQIAVQMMAYADRVDTGG